MPSASRTIHKIVNSQLSIVNCRAAFTLVETLVVIGILSAIVGVTLVFLTNILRGSNQASITADVKQNGQIVLDSIDRQIRNATSVRQFIGPDSSNAIELELSSGDYAYLACFNGVSNTKNGRIGIANVPAQGEPAQASYLTLTNVDIVSGVDIICNSPCLPNCTFSVAGSPSDPFPQIVSIGFKVSQGVAAPSRTDFKASAEFKTTISLRKY